MTGAMEQYLGNQYVYRFRNNPDRVRSREDAVRYGLNCVSLAHLVLKDLFDYELPAELGCAELYRDQEHFEPVESVGAMQRGDLVWFGVAEPRVQAVEFTPRYEDGQLVNWADFPVKHVAIHTGERRPDHQLLHATYVEGTNAVWSLGKFANYGRYKKLYGITRLKAADISDVAT
jgi:hypothetical protein